MAHDHSHSHAHSHPEKTNILFALAVGLNLAFTAVEAVYAILANSMSLLADAGHNLGDVLGLLLAWGANWLLTRPSSERYSYGYRRTTVLAAVTNALLLVATSALIAYGAVSKLFNPTPVQEMTVIIVASIGILVNTCSALLFFRGQKEDLNIKGAFLHLLGDALISVGVVVTAVIVLYTGWMWIDPVMSLLIVVAILAGTWGLLRDSLILLLDAVPHAINQAAVKHYFESKPEVTAIHDLHIWGLSTREVALTVHLIAPKATFSDEDYYHIHQDLKTQFGIEHATVQIEQGTYPCHLGDACQ